MRTIKVEKRKSHIFVTDWNFKQWALTKNTDGTVSCNDIRGYVFRCEIAFVATMYGASEIRDTEGNVLFKNYTIEAV